MNILNGLPLFWILLEFLAFIFQNTGIILFITALLILTRTVILNLLQKQAYRYTKLEKWQESIYYFTWLLRLKSDNPDISNALANAYAETGNFQKALSLYQKALKNCPDDFLIYNNLAMTCLDMGDYSGANDYFAAGYRLRRGISVNEPGNNYEHVSQINSQNNNVNKKNKPGVSADGNEPANFLTAVHKLKHDIEQFDYLLQSGLIPPGFNRIRDNYQNILAEISVNAKSSLLVTLSEQQSEDIALTYEKNFFYEPIQTLKGPLINSCLDFQSLQEKYLQQKPGFIYFDDFLSEEALQTLRDFCLNSTIWHEYRRSRGYLAANINDGFSCIVLYQLARALTNQFPLIFKDFTLRNMWAFKYDSQMAGVVTHADEAVINVNFWLTPDSANLDAASGGMIVYDTRAPAEWGFEKYNRDTGIIRQYLDQAGTNACKVPYKQNRVVIFNSDLFHETDVYKFREGYCNRRINITMLFGKRQ